MSGVPVLILDDDQAFRNVVADELGAAGFNVAVAGMIADAEAMILQGSVRFEALVFDVGLPDGDGRDLCARLRAAGVHIPVIMLTGLDGDIDVVRGLDAGANDYVAKPCSAAVLIARLRAQLRQHESSMDAVFSLGPWRFYPAQRLLRDAKDARVWLTAREVDILRFMHRSGGAVSKKALLSEVWGYSPSVSSHTLETHIYRLRQKIEADPSVARLLLTIEGGYKFAEADDSGEQNS